MPDLRLEKKNLRFDQPAGPIFPVQGGFGTPGQGIAAGDSSSFDKREGFDLSLSSSPAWGQLELEDGFRSQVILSVLTDRLAEPSDEVPDSGNPAFPERRGYWGDFLSPLGPDDRYGSRLWLLEGQALNDETRARARSYVLEGLAWLEAEGIGVVTVETRIPSRGVLEIFITVTDATTNAERRYSLQWDAMAREGV
jgi:phage gp46-like protein